MTAHVWPIDNVSNTGRALRQTALAAGLAMANPARPLGGVSGVRPGTPATIGSVTSTLWTVNPFGGTIDGEALAIAGPYAYAFDAAVTGGVIAAGATARTDRLDVQISDPAEGDGSSGPSVQVVYTQGTTTTPPAAPARTHPLFLINVPVTGSPTLTWNASFTAAAGGFVEFLTLAALNLWTPADPAQHATVTADPTTTNNGDYRWSGSGWLPIPAIDARNTTTRSNTPALRAGTASGTTSAGGDLTVTFPAAFPNNCWAVLVTDSNTGSGIGLVGLKVMSKSTTQFVVRHYSPSTGATLNSFASSFTYIAFGE